MWERKGMEGSGGLRVDSRLSYADWIKCVKGREWGNCVLTADCVRGLDRGWEGKGVGDYVLTVDFVRGIE